jgi:hypothetical protein
VSVVSVLGQIIVNESYLDEEPKKLEADDENEFGHSNVVLVNRSFQKQKGNCPHV